MADYRYQQSQDIELEQMGGETVLLNVSTSSFCLLNQSAAIVWNELEEPTTVESIASALCAAFQGVSESKAANDAKLILGELKDKGFVVSAKKNQRTDMQNDKNDEITSPDRPLYETSRAKFLNEQEIFAALQTSVNAATWWSM